MESSEEDESSAQSQADRLIREEAYYRFVNSITEEDYTLMRDNNLLGTIGETTEEELVARLRQAKDNLLLGAGAQDLSHYCGERVKITCFAETEHMTESEQTDSLSWTLGNPSTTSSSDTTRPNVEPEESLFSRLLREFMENTQPVSILATISTSHESTTEALMEDQESSTEGLVEEQESTAEAQMEDRSIGIRRSRRRRQRNRRHRTRNQSGSHPDIINPTVERFHHNISSADIEEPSVSETETVSRNEPHAVLRQQITRSVLQCRDNFPASELTDDLPVEFSRRTAGNTESVESRTRHTLVVPDFQVTIFPGQHSLRDDSDTIIEIPETLYTCTSVERAQEELRNIFSRAEEAGIRSEVGTLRIPAFRSSNTDLGATASSESQRRTFGQSATRSAESRNIFSRAEEAGIRSDVGTLRIPAFRSSNTDLGATASSESQRRTFGQSATRSAESRNIFSRAEEAGIRSDVGTLRIPAFRSSNTDLGATASSESQRRTFGQSVTRSAESRNIFSRAEEAGIRSEVGTLRIPAFRSSNTDLGATASSESQRRTFGQSATRFAESSNVTDSDSDLQLSGLPPTQNPQRAESQNRRDSSSLNLSLESLAGAAAMYHPSFSYSTGASFDPMFSASSPYENPEILEMMFGAINERRVSLGSGSQAREESQQAHSEISSESEPWFFLDEVYLIDEPIFNQPTGLTKEQIDNLIVRVFSGNDTPQSCSVCLTEYTDGNKIRILPCSHEYHVHCIDPWLADNSTCPICRRAITGYGD